MRVALCCVPCACALQVAAGGDPLGTLDFLQVHGYPLLDDPARDANINMFLRPKGHWNNSKPILVGEHWEWVSGVWVQCGSCASGCSSVAAALSCAHPLCAAFALCCTHTHTHTRTHRRSCQTAPT
jgi:hypothetical protein